MYSEDEKASLDKLLGEIMEYASGRMGQELKAKHCPPPVVRPEVDSAEDELSPDALAALQASLSGEGQ